MEVNKLTVQQEETLRAALERIDKTALGTLFVIDDDSKLVGVITDGDIRRGLINGIKLADKINQVMNTDFVSSNYKSDNRELLDKLNNHIKIIPLIDEENRLVDYASINKVRRIPIAAPLLNGNELVYVSECIKTSWISSQGKYVTKFEELFKEYHQGRTALAVSNGTVALHLALEALGIGNGDEVLVPDFTFAATINAIIYTGATPVLVDIQKDTWNMDPYSAELKINEKTKAIVPVHIYGQPCNMVEINKLADMHSLLVIEDCAEALGSSISGSPVGTFSDAATFSFFGNKTITTGEGGMVLFKDENFADKAKMLRDHGMNKMKRYWHDFVGFNYRLTNLQAAVGVAQFERLSEFVHAKQSIANKYTKTLSRFTNVKPPIENDDYVNSYWLYTFLLDSNSSVTRDEFIQKLYNKGIEARPVFYPLHKMPPYQSYGKEAELKVSVEISSHGISLPSSPSLAESEIIYICEQLENILTTIN